MIDKPRIEKAIKEILYAIGENPEREGLIETPHRVAEMYEELFAGLGADAAELAKLFNEESCEGIIVVKDIPLHSMCEHHLLPFIGKVSVAYLPQDKKVLGLSKIARITDTLSKKPQLQERLGNEIAEVICKCAGAKGVLVQIEAEHLCMTMRGIKKLGSKTVTIAARGCFSKDAAIRVEALTLIGGNNG